MESVPKEPLSIGGLTTRGADNTKPIMLHSRGKLWMNLILRGQYHR